MEANAGHVGKSGRGLTVKGLRRLGEQLIPGLRNVRGGVCGREKNEKQTPPGVSKLDRLEREEEVKMYDKKGRKDCD